MSIKSEIVVEGRVIDQITEEGIPFVSIMVELDNQTNNPDRPFGIISDIEGNFSLELDNLQLPVNLHFNHLSYEDGTITLDQNITRDLIVRLVPKVFRGDELVVISSLINEDHLRSTTSTERISSVQIQQVASFDAYDMVSTLRGVDITTQSMNFTTVSTRGFNTGANARFLQLTDGVDNQAPGLGFSIGQLLGPVELDIASVELNSGPSSARYGSSAMSGVMETISRDPFNDAGLSVQVKGGVNGLRLGGDSPTAASGDGMYEFSFRYAGVIHEKLGFKITGSLLEGTDWRANNYDNIGWGEPNQRHDSIIPAPGYDGVNVYGDESYSYLQLINSGIIHFMPVTRTGYREEDLVDYDISTSKLNGSLIWKFQPDFYINTEARYGIINTLFTNDSRIRLQDFEAYQLKSEIVFKDSFVRAYTTWQNSGNSYDTVRLANLLLNQSKPDSHWYRDYRSIYNYGWPALGIPANNHNRAREFADGPRSLNINTDTSPRLEPGTEKFNDTFEKLIHLRDSDKGAGIKDNSQLYHFDAGSSISEVFDLIDIEIGGNFRFFDLDSDGTIFPDSTSNNITNYQYGIYVGSEVSLQNETLNLEWMFRYDKNENFKGSISPQLGLSYILNDRHYFRASYQYGFRYPSVREQFLNQNLGNARLLGGMAQITDQYQLQNNSITEQGLERYNQAIINDMTYHPVRNPAPYSRTLAEIKNLQILENSIVSPDQLKPIKPETTHAFEVGYRHLFTPLLYLDLNYYVNIYDNFIGLMSLVKPRISPELDLYTAAGQLNNSGESDRFYVNTNASNRVSIHGLSFDVKYQSGGFFAGLNGTYSEMLLSSVDPIMPGFNTPPFKLNFEWGNRKIAEHVGFKMIYRYRTSHDWQSPFLDGRIDSYGHFDFQVNVQIPRIGSMIKVGVTNLGVDNYYNVYGGPEIGSIIFTTFTYNPKLF